MININLRLYLQSGTFENGSVVTVFFKHRTNIIGTCSIDESENGAMGTFTVEEALHDNLYIYYIYSAAKENLVLDGILLDDGTHNKETNTVGSSRIS